MKITHSKRALHSLPLLLMLPMTNTWAQAPTIEEVLVTTQFREESSQRLAISSRILSGETIERLDINSNATLAHTTPGLSYAEFAAGQSYLALRGILSVDDGPGMDSSVVAFVDGVYIGRISNIDFDLMDIERIEVLRGPQGTLFGRNAIGGAINILTRPATADTALTLRATAGNYDTLRYGATINGALSPTVNARLSLNHREHSGFTRNILLNEDNQTEDKTSMRGLLNYQSGKQDWQLSLDHANDDRADMGRFPVEESGLGSRAQWLLLGGEEGKSTAPISGFSKRSAYGISLNGKTDINSNNQLNTIVAWRQSDSDWAMASTGAPIAINPPFPAMDLAAGEFGSDILDLIHEQVEQSSIELRWLHTLNEQLHVTFGAFALNEKTARRENFQLLRNSVGSPQTLVGDEISQQHNTTKSIAFYSQAQWSFSEYWKLIAGARWTRDSKTTQSTSINCGHDHPLVEASGLCAVNSGAFLNIMSSVFQTQAQKSWTDTSPKFTLQYSPNAKWMTYASAAKGFKSGGFPGSPGSQQIATTPVAPEEAWSYELGLKSDLFERRVRLNGSVFYTDYRDLQIVRFGPSPDNPGFGSFTTTNIGEAKISGAEIEIQWLVNKSLDLSASYGYLDSEIDDLLIETIAGIVDASGSQLRQAPRNKYHLSAEYTLLNHQQWGEYTLSLNHHHSDTQLNDYVNTDTRIDALTQSNGAINWTSSNQQWTASLWLKNIENERGIAHSYTIAGGVYGVWSPPRTVGLSMSREL